MTAIDETPSPPLPRVLVNTRDLGVDGSATSGAVWKLQMRERDLDANVIALPAGKSIESHIGPDADVLIHVLDGNGQLVTEEGRVDLNPGMIVWLPRRSARGFIAGPSGIRYLTVHQRRQALMLDSSRLTTTQTR